MNSKVLVISFSCLASDPRVARHIAALSTGGHDVATCGIGPPAIPVARHFDVAPVLRGLRQRALALFQLLSRRYEDYYWGNPMVRDAKRLLLKEKFDAILANDLSTLPLALRIAGSAPVLFDAHEFSPDEFGEQLRWRLLHAPYVDYLCRTYLRKATASMTVCEGIALAYRQRYSIAMEVLTNAASMEPAPVVDASSRNVVRMIHHGGAIPSRHIEDMIEMMRYLDERFTLDLILVPGSAAYIRHLKKIAAGDRRVVFKDPVPTARIVQVCSAYDIGLYLLRPVNRNHEYALPNKFFEFIQARLALAIGPSPEMARIVHAFECGVVADEYTPKSLAHKLVGLTPEALRRMKSGTDRAARVHNAQANAARLCDAVERMLRVAA